MEVITMESEVVKMFVERINRLENYLKNRTRLDMKLEDTMELSTRDVMAALGVSESTVYRWRKDNKIKYRLSPGGEARFLYVQLELAIKGGGIVVRGMDKNELLDRLCRFKEDVIINKLAQS